MLMDRKKNIQVRSRMLIIKQEKRNIKEMSGNMINQPVEVKSQAINQIFLKLLS